MSSLLVDGDAPEVVGGATIEIRPGRATTLEALDVSRTSVGGRVMDVATSTPVTGGRVLVCAKAADGTESSFDGTVSADGTFQVSTPALAGALGPIDVELMFMDRRNATCAVRLLVP